MKNSNKLFIKSIIIICIILSLVGLIFLCRSSQNYQSEDANKLHKFLEKKGWIESQKLQAITKIPGRKLPTFPPVKPLKSQCPGGECPGLGKGFYLSKETQLNHCNDAEQTLNLYDS